jgi:hypothetical protein
MALPAWSWPSSGAQARGVSLVPYGSGVAVADWTEPVLWPFSGGVFGFANNTGGGSYGFAGAAPDASGGIYAVTWDGTLRHRLYTGGGGGGHGATGTITALPSGQAYVGAAYAAGGGFAVAASGQVYNASGALLGAFPLPVRSVVASGSTIAACMAASGIGLMNASAGATGFIALPSGITTLACAALASGQPLAVAGWKPTFYAGAGFGGAALDPQDTLLMLFANNNGSATLWSAANAFADAWSPGQVLSGLANLTSVTWRPDGTQALCVSPTSGAVQALEFAAGALSLQQTLAVSGACSVAIGADSTDALVAQSGLAQAMPLTFAGSTWSTGVAVTGLAGIVAVAQYGASGAVAALSGSLRYLNLVSSGVWSLGASIALPFVPTAMTVDTFGQVYAAGSGAVAMASGSTLVASGTFSGSPASILVQQGRIIVPDIASNLLRVFGLSASGVLSLQSQLTPSPALAALGGLALSSTTLFAHVAGGMSTFGFSGSPYTLTPAVSGAVAFWNGSSWTTTPMGVGHKPTAIGLDASGNAWVATVQNTLWNITSGGAVLSSGALPVFAGQSQTTSLSVSSILSTASGVYAATSIPGVLGQIG